MNALMKENPDKYEGYVYLDIKKLPLWRWVYVKGVFIFLIGGFDTYTTCWKAHKFIKEVNNLKWW
jgi:hypothetical protein